MELINTVVHTVEEVYKQQSGTIMDYPDVFLLYEYETVDELAGIVKKLSNDIHDHLQKVKQNHKLNLIEQMKDYLQTQYTDCDFTIQQMADHFNMSLANLSQYFKEHAGSNVLDFETNLKLDKAKQLLTSSQMPIKDIALEVGYYNVNSFIRRFKQVIGITPGDYRKQYHH
ncbi:HTH-type transcriptional regulator YesS [compost metagenome]